MKLNNVRIIQIFCGFLLASNAASNKIIENLACKNPFYSEEKFIEFNL